MLFRRREAEPARRRLYTSGTEAHAVPGQPCPSLAKVLERAFRKRKPEILDLGPLCGPTAVYLASRGARVTVAEFDPPLPPPPYEPGQDPPKVRPLKIHQENERFDLVLAWEQIDFVPPDRLAEFARELRRILTLDGWLLLLSLAKHSGEPVPRGRYRVLADDLIQRDPVPEDPRPRWEHPTRSIERALRGFSLQGLHLQRNQTREFLAMKIKQKKNPA